MTQLVYLKGNIAHVISDRRSTATFEVESTLTPEELDYLLTNDFTKSTPADDDHAADLVLKRVRYEGLLAAHDWMHQYSDDFSVYKRGFAEYNELMELAKEVDADHSLYLQAFRTIHKV